MYIGTPLPVFSFPPYLKIYVFKKHMYLLFFAKQAKESCDESILLSLVNHLASRMWKECGF